MKTSLAGIARPSDAGERHPLARREKSVTALLRPHEQGEPLPADITMRPGRNSSSAGRIFLEYALRNISDPLPPRMLTLTMFVATPLMES